MGWKSSTEKNLQSMTDLLHRIGFAPLGCSGVASKGRGRNPTRGVRTGHGEWEWECFLGCPNAGPKSVNRDAAADPWKYDKLDRSRELAGVPSSTPPKSGHLRTERRAGERPSGENVGVNGGFFPGPICKLISLVLSQCRCYFSGIFPGASVTALFA